MTNLQLNIRRPKAARAARELAKLMGVPVSIAVEEVLTAALSDLQRSASPATFRAGLIERAGKEVK